MELSGKRDPNEEKKKRRRRKKDDGDEGEVEMESEDDEDGEDGEEKKDKVGVHYFSHMFRLVEELGGYSTFFRLKEFSKYGSSVIHRFQFTTNINYFAKAEASRIFL